MFRFLLSMIPVVLSASLTPLNDHIIAYVQENNSPAQGASFRLMISKHSDETAVVALDTTLDRLSEIDLFFAHCQQQIGHHLNHVDLAHPMVMVAVGDFDSSEMTRWIQERLDPRFLNSSKESSSPRGRVELHIDYPVDKSCPLEDLWVNLFAQQLLQQRLERSTRLLNEHWVHPHPQFVSPVHGFASVDEKDYMNALSFLLWEVEQIKNEGFNLNEFLTLKATTLIHLTHLHANSYPESPRLATFYTDMIALRQKEMSYENFLIASTLLVPTIQFPEVQKAANRLLQDDNQFLHIRYPANMLAPRLTSQDLQHIKSKIAEMSQEPDWHEDSEDIFLLNDPIIPERRPLLIHNPFDVLPPEELETNPDGNPFLSLPLTEAEKETISFIITNMADKNIFELAFDKKKMEEKGKQINHVHPLRFIGYILSNHELKRALKKASKNSFKWDAFVDGFVKRMKEEHAKNNLQPYLEGFAQQVDTMEEKVVYYFQRKDWEGLLTYLM